MYQALNEQSATKTQSLIATSAGAAIVAFVIGVVYARGHFLDHYLPISQSLISVILATDILAAALLLQWFRMTHRVHFIGLATAHAYSAVMAMIQILLTSYGEQQNHASVLLWTAWQGGMGLCLVMSAVISRLSQNPIAPRDQSSMILLFSLVTIIPALLFFLSATLPGQSMIKRLLLVEIPLTHLTMGLSVAAVVALYLSLGLKSLLNQWTLLSALGLVADVSVTIHFGESSEGNTGIYAARLVHLAGVLVVCSALLTELQTALNSLERNQKMLAERALRDGLTGLFNRWYFDHRLQNEVRRARRDKIPLSLLLLDVDHFKAFNDHFGHQRGDECLKSIAQAIQGVIQRPGDFCARYGGEEFVVVLAGTSAQGALKVAEKLRREIGKQYMPAAPAASREFVTASIGAACLLPVDEAKNAEERLIGQADQQLYRSKQKGRDCASFSFCKPPEPLKA